MATIPRASVDYLTREINALSADAQDRVMRILGSISWRPDNIAECRELVTEALRIIMPEYTTLSAQAAADFYDAARELSVGERMGAVAYSGYEQEKTDGAVRAFVQRVVDGKPIESFNDAVLQRIDYEMKLSAANSTVYNGERDPKSVRYARVPTGSETCDFCLMLASRGFVYRSQATAMSHVHAECVLPETVIGALDVKFLMRREFEGDVVDITTSRGRHLSVTPNHPVLTVNGWVEAGIIHDGDALLCGFNGDGHNFCVPYVDDSPASAEEIFESLSLLYSSGLVSVEVPTVDFYGETVTNGNVEIVDVDSLLKGHIIPISNECFSDESLTFGALLDRCKTLYRSCTSYFGDCLSSAPASCIMSGLRLCGSIVGRHFCSSDNSSFGVAPAVDSSIVKPPINNLPGNTVGIGQFQDAVSSLISLDEVGRCGDSARAYLDAVALEYSGSTLVGDSKLFGNCLDALPSGIEIDYVSIARTRHFVGHVYNLSAGGRWFTANGIITHNCDCRVVPGWSGDEVEGYDPDAIYERWQDRIGELASERAERKGTTESEERSAIIRGYGNAAKLAKHRNKTA